MLINPYRFGSFYRWNVNGDVLSPLDPYLASVWKLNGTINDALFNNNMTNVNATINDSYLTLNNNQLLSKGVGTTTNLPYGTNDFTFSCWVYPTSWNGSNINALFIRVGGSPFGTYYTELYFNASKIIYTDNVYIGPSFVVETSNPPSLNQWNHIVLTKQGSLFSIYLNGSLKQSTTSSNYSQIPSDSNLQIGGNNGANQSIIGNLKEVYFWNGIGLSNPQVSRLYNSGTGSFYGLDSYTKLLCRFDGTNDSTTMVDATNRHTLTPYVNAKLSTSQKKFGTASLYLDGSSYVSCPDSNDFHFGSGDFTIDFWIYFNSLSNYLTLLSQDGPSVNRSWIIQCDETNKNVYWTVPEGTLTSTSDSPLSLSTWTHIAVVRYGNIVTIYINGTNKASHDYGAGYTIPTPNSQLEIGRQGGHGNYTNAYIDEVRISKGIARWISNFTPPNQQYYIS